MMDRERGGGGYNVWVRVGWRTGIKLKSNSGTPIGLHSIYIYIRKNPQDIDSLGCAAGESRDVGFVAWFFLAIGESIPKTGGTRPAIMKISLQSEYMAEQPSPYPKASVS